MLVVKSPLFFVNYIYILNFLSQLNKRKKWESGQKARKPAWIRGFSKPTFVFKSGQKVGKWPLFLPKSSENASKF